MSVLHIGTAINFSYQIEDLRVSFMGTSLSGWGPTIFGFLCFGRVGFWGRLRLFGDFSVLVGWFFLAGSDYFWISLFWSGGFFWPAPTIWRFLCFSRVVFFGPAPTIWRFLCFGRDTPRILPRPIANFFILVGVPKEFHPDYLPVSSL